MWVSAVWKTKEMASSVDLFTLWANWWRYNVAGMSFLMCERTSLLKHFITVRVRATGWSSFREVMFAFIGTKNNDGWWLLLETMAGWKMWKLHQVPQHSLRIQPGIPSGPVAFCGLTICSAWCTSFLHSFSGCSSAEVGIAVSVGLSRFLNKKMKEKFKKLK